MCVHCVALRVHCVEYVHARVRVKHKLENNMHKIL